MTKYGVWFENDTLNQFCIDELEVDPKYNSYNFQGIFIRNILETKRMKENSDRPKKGSKMGWENYMNLFKSVGEAKAFLIKKAFRNDI
jgi:hypothetical protein